MGKKEVTLPVHHKSLSMAPAIQICVFDWDSIGTNDFVGFTTITCEEVRNMNKSLTELKPEWRYLQTFDNKETTGKLLVSFQLLTQEEKMIVGPDLPNIRPDTIP